MSQSVILSPSSTLMTRVRRTLRSITLGPWNSKDKTLARYFSDGAKNLSGVSVTEDSAFNYAAFWQGVGLIAGHMASFPLIHYKRSKNGGKERYTDSRLYRIIHDEFNPEMTSFVAREIMQAHAIVWGNAYAEIERDVTGRPLALWPLTPDRVVPTRDLQGNVVYRVNNPMTGEVTIAAANMLHVPAFGFDGLQGYGVVRRARESLGLAIAAERFGGTFFGNGSTFGGVLTAPETLDEETETALRASLEKFHQGPDRAHRFLILHGGLTYAKLGIPPNDAQFLETRKFQIEEVARWLNLPPHKLKHLDRSTNNNIEHQGIEYYTDTLLPWTVRWEQELNRKLIKPLERNQQYIEHLVDAVQRGDITTRYAAYGVGRQWGWLSADDIRGFENMNPLPNDSGKMYLVPVNMVPADRVNELLTAQIDAKAAKPDTPIVPDGGPTRGEVEAAEIRAALAEQAATEARLKAEAEREARVAAAARGSATAEELERLRLTEADARDHAAQLTQLAAEQQAQYATMRDGHDVTVRALATVEAALATAEQRALAVEASAEAANVRGVALAADLSAAEARERQAITDAQAALQLVDEARAAAEQAGAETAREAQARVVAERMSAEAVAAAERATAEIERLTRAAESDTATRETTIAELADARVTVARLEEAVQAATRESELARSAQEATIASLESERVRLEAEHATILAERTALDVRLTAESEALAVAQARSDADRDTYTARVVKTIAARRHVFAAAVARMARREADRARRHQATPEKLRAWLDDFAESEAPICRETWAPSIAEHLACIASERSADEATDEMVSAHMAEFERQLHRALEAPPEEFHAKLDRVLTRWETDRPAVVADALMNLEIEYVRAVR